MSPIHPIVNLLLPSSLDSCACFEYLSLEVLVASFFLEGGDAVESWVLLDQADEPL